MVKHIIMVLLAITFLAAGCASSTEPSDLLPTYYTESEIKAYITPECQLVKDCLKDILGDPPYEPSKDGFGLLQDWVANNIDYVSDEEQWGVIDYWQTSEETLSSRTGDCEDFAILLCTFLRAYGIDAKQVYVVLGVDDEGYGHAFLVEDWYNDGEWRAIEPQAPTQVFPGRRKFNLVDAQLDEYEIYAAFNDLYYYGESYPWDA